MNEPKYHNTAGHPRISTGALAAESEKQNQSKQCATEQQSWECPNMVEVNSDFDCEYYQCNLCNRTMALYYDDME